ncbi:O-antigen polymerase [Aeromonas caviae]
MSFKRLFLMLSFVLFLIPMSIKGVSTYLVSLFMLLALSFLLNVKLTKSAVFVMLSFVFLLSFNIANSILHVSFDLYLIKVTLIGMILFLNAFLLVSCYQKIYAAEAEKAVLKSVLIIASINSLFAILFIIFGSLRSFFYLFLDTNPLNSHHMNLGVRSSGLFYFGASILSAFNFIIMYLSCVYYSIYAVTRNDKLFSIVAFFFSVIGVFLSGRFGLMLSLLGSLIVIFLPERFHFIKKKQLLTYIYMVAVVLLPLVYFYYDALELIFNRTFELFINYINGNGFNSESTDVLSKMYFLPDNIIFGDGIFGRDSESTYIHSDSGYVLMLFYSGFLGVAIYLLHFLFVLLMGIQRFSMYKVFGDKVSLRLLILCLFVLLIGNFKDVYFYGSQGVTQIFMISVALFCRKPSH